MQDKKKCAYNLIRDDFKSAICISYSIPGNKDIRIEAITNILKISFNLKGLNVLYLFNGEKKSRIFPYYLRPFISHFAFYEGSLDEEVLPFE